MYAVVIKGSKRHIEVNSGNHKRLSPLYSTKKAALDIIDKAKQPEKLTIINVNR